MPNSDLEVLLKTLQVNVAGLTECTVRPGWRLSFRASELAAIHYNLAGIGQMVVGNAPAIALGPHTLVIVPPGQPLHINVTDGREMASSLRGAVKAPCESGATLPAVGSFAASDTDSKMILISGYLRASYGMSIDLFTALRTPIVEQFEA